MIAIPAWIYAVAATTAFAGVSWLVLCAFQVGYRLGRLCAFKEIERKHGLIRDARVWFIVIPRPGCPKLGREATRPRGSKPSQTAPTIVILPARPGRG